MHVNLLVRLKDGTQVTKRCQAPLGGWSRPIAPKDIENKAHDLIDPNLLPEQRQVFWHTMAQPVKNISITSLMRCLT
jgi:hypothetical protein